MFKDDFFKGTEIKVNQSACGKNTTTFKLGDSMKADHKVELASVSSNFKCSKYND